MEVLKSEGPPPVQDRRGPADLYVFEVSRPARPDLELRTGERRLGFTDVAVTHGLSGARMTGRDESGVFELEITVDSAGQTRQALVRTLSIKSKLPHSVVNGLEFIRDWSKGGEVCLAIPYGPILHELGALDDPNICAEAEEWIDIAGKLIRLQSVSMHQLCIPESLTAWESEEIATAVRLLDGEIVTSEWTSTQFTVNNIEAFEASTATGPQFQFLYFKPFHIEYDQQEFGLSGTIGVWGVAQLADPSMVDSVAQGQSVAIIPVPGHKLSRQYSPQSFDSIHAQIQ
ncbi:hypothetical protein CIW51_31650 [Mycolicibacterium sp. P9-22]|nr:hypothetical protein CIW51_31650 [Mycolicibacterium sp. P9-22]